MSSDETSKVAVTAVAIDTAIRYVQELPHRCKRLDLVQEQTIYQYRDEVANLSKSQELALKTLATNLHLDSIDSGMKLLEPLNQLQEFRRFLATIYEFYSDRLLELENPEVRRVFISHRDQIFQQIIEADKLARRQKNRLTAVMKEPIETTL